MTAKRLLSRAIELVLEDWPEDHPEVEDFLKEARAFVASPSEAVRPSPGLYERCKEVIDWHNTGVLKGNALRVLGQEWKAKGAGDHETLRLAENQTAAEAMEYVLRSTAPEGKE